MFLKFFLDPVIRSAIRPPQDFGAGDHSVKVPTRPDFLFVGCSISLVGQPYWKIYSVSNIAFVVVFVSPYSTTAVADFLMYVHCYLHSNIQSARVPDRLLRRRPMRRCRLSWKDWRRWVIKKCCSEMPQNFFDVGYFIFFIMRAGEWQKNKIGTEKKFLSLRKHFLIPTGHKIFVVRNFS